LPGTGHENHIEIKLLDHSAQMHVDKARPGLHSVSKQAMVSKEVFDRLFANLID